MITYKRLITVESLSLSEVWKLYENTFPLNERRNIEGQTHILKLNNYHCESIHQNEKFIGLIFWWNFDSLRYIEHLAIIPGQA
ncbi:hypothetical protein [Formosa sp. PL04]|uniref:hypothetical protein n=1 Tax=Formosa sp. PL04 TaxID=3081755 RepID=UPI0029816A28|nr:hypothetical protein [Formosa sp. PL04]MDW5291036.1 hypothetical protein [Formosa sp. PL04]